MTRTWSALGLGWLLVVVFVVAMLATTSWSQTPAVDPQSLVGQWSGSWVGAHVAKTNGRYYLTIERVEGDKVIGKGEYTGKTTTEFKVNGRLSGNVLTFAKTELTIHDNQMSGSNSAMKITLTKEK
jgi:hypothetical protein